MRVLLPQWIKWSIDLRRSDEELFSHKLLHRIVQPNYTNFVEASLMSAQNIESLFLPIYMKLIAQRDDFRLDAHEVTQKIFVMSASDDYRLLWFRHGESGVNLGGVIIKVLPLEVRVAYRAFDHDIAKSMGLPDMDYYSEYELHRIVRGMGLKILSQGRDKHPLTQLGLSTYKFRIGAEPGLSSNIESKLYGDEEWKNMLAEHENVGYYSDPVGELYTKFHLFGESDNERVGNLIKVVQRAGIEIIFEKLEK